MGVRGPSRANSSRTRAGLIPAAALLAGAVLLAASLAGHAAANQVLANGDFESWPGQAPTSWHTMGQVTKATSPSVSGNSARLGDQASLSETIPAIAGATYVFSFSVAAEPGTERVSYSIQFENDGFDLLGSSQSQAGALSGAFSFHSTTGIAPPGTAFAQVLIATVDGPVYVDNASLDETVPPPTATPTDAPTPSPTATMEPGESPSPADSPTDEPTTGGGSPASSKTPTATRTPTNTKTPTPTKTPTNTRTPTPPKGEKTSAPTVKPPAAPGGKPPTPVATTAGSSAFGGMLYNGDFEVDDSGKPDGWSKFGGTMTLTSAAYAGTYSAALDSSTSSTKWLYQVVSVEGGEWYALDGFAAVRGAGEAFIRVSWYPSDDGSGTSSSQSDSDVSNGAEWLAVATGPVQAPDDAHSARARLMLRPSGDASVEAMFDDVEMNVTDERPPDDAPSETPVAPGGGVEDDAPPLPRGNTAAPTRTPAPASGTSVPRSAPEDHAAQGLRLSEILSDPVESGQDAPYEWVELVNVGTATVSTAGWKLGDGKEMDALPALDVAPSEYVVVAGRSAALPDGVTVVRVADGQIGGGLNNSGDTVHLLAPTGNEVDSISYGDNDTVFDPPPAAPPQGGTLGVRVPNSDPDADNWALTDHPTPGEANSFAAARPKPATGGAVADAPATDVQPTPLVIRPAASSVPVALWVAVSALGAAVVVLAAFFAWDRFVAPKDHVA